MTGSLEDALRAHIEATGTTPCEWGKSDCTSFAAAWIETVHGRPVKRPRWKSKERAMALIKKRGSLLDLWSDVLGDFGLLRGMGGMVPEPGDVGLINTHLAGVVGGIFVKPHLFAWRSEPFGTRLMHIRSFEAFWSIR
ncbi:DUF6950 family protein [Agrobacterium vitis]|uniref:DUF6950 family protein n=1 Tax=Agrobacterium vitis TaxID=373 RepID=UPI001F30546D|nr:hypothetical protein [Agrobacterium vitis]MCF1452301.1 hypothetical protein [Agrobacterium vitis]